MSAAAETENWNIQTKYGISPPGIQNAIHDAKDHFGKAPDDVVILDFDEDSFFLNPPISDRAY